MKSARRSAQAAIFSSGRAMRILHLFASVGNQPSRPKKVILRPTSDLLGLGAMQTVSQNSEKTGIALFDISLGINAAKSSEKQTIGMPKSLLTKADISRGNTL